MRRPSRRGAAALLLAAGLLLGACAPAVMPPPDERPSETRRSWLPEGTPRAVILAVHGFNDYGRAFEAFGTYAAARGFAVHAYDHRGFGANLDAGRWPGINVLTGDLRWEATQLRALYPDLPLYLLGESMGAAVIAAAMGRPDPPDVDGVIFSAPAVWGGRTMPGLYRVALSLAVQVVPWWRLTGSGLGVRASDNDDALRQLGADPLVIKATRVDAIAGLVTLMDRAAARMPGVPGPLLLLTGANDEIVPRAAFDAIRPYLTAEPCTAVHYPEGWHLLLRDLQRQVVWDDILAWIDGEPLPSGLAEACGAGATQEAALVDPDAAAGTLVVTADAL
ncbi:MAG TPA: alpha/beta fold hydrolase [Geminicoccaceae bacterium]|nr:alpha/beta fold hydrolase [Geminicoccaceae bacterium]